MKPRPLPAAALGVLLLSTPSLRADEGLWTYDDPPLAALKAKHGFEPTRAWLDRLRLASVRFMDGGSGSFVSAQGLMITNHHVGFGCIQNVSSAERDYVKDGFYAAAREQELPCPGYEVNVLVATSDVSARVLGAARPEMSAADARAARQAATAVIENECNARGGRRCDVVSFYQGGEYRLYEYVKYTDVRLAFAPEQQAAFYGGDPDNFTFPRHDLDICLMRAYENGRPVQPASHLRWTGSGISEGDLVLVSGHPGSTSRLETLARLEYLRDTSFPLRLEQFRRRIGVLEEFSAQGEEPRRRAADLLFSIQNSLKAYEGYARALADAVAMARKADEERALRTAVAADPELARTTGDPWAAIEGVQRRLASRTAEARLVRFAGSRLFEIAGEIVQYVAEVAKPNEQRYEEFVDANLDSLRNELFSPAPIHADVEQISLGDQLGLALEKLGPQHPFVKAALDGRTPAEAARALLAGTRLADPAERRALLSGGSAAVARSNDALIVLARRLDPQVRETRRFLEDEIEAPTTRAMEKVAQARFKIHGRALPPDATFTLRLSFGTVKGFPAEGTQFPPFTTFHGLYDRSLSHAGKPPWQLPARWQQRQGALALGTPLNFAATCDIIGGNSGSPVVDRAGDFVGIIFDGNIHSLAWNYYFDERRARSVAVDARGIVEALRAVYGADALVAELTGR